MDQTWNFIAPLRPERYSLEELTLRATRDPPKLSTATGLE